MKISMKEKMRKIKKRLQERLIEYEKYTDGKIDGKGPPEVEKKKWVKIAKEDVGRDD